MSITATRAAINTIMEDEELLEYVVAILCANTAQEMGGWLEANGHIREAAPVDWDYVEEWLNDSL